MQQIFKIKIDNVAFGGDGVGRVNNLVCFVPGTLQGEFVEVKITKEKHNYLRAKLLKVIEASPERIDIVCPYAVIPTANKGADFCPGCAYMHASYNEELRMKHQQFIEMLERNGKFDINNDIEKVNDIVGSDSELYYRNKITLHAQLEGRERFLGYIKSDNENVVDIEQCAIADKLINKKLADLRSNKGFYHSLHREMSVTLKKITNKKGEDEVLFWRNNPKENASWVRQQTIYGNFSTPLGSFQQINQSVTDKLMKKVHDIIKETKTQSNVDSCVDLYCGSGLFAMAAAEAGIKNITGIEADEKAVVAATFNLKDYDLQDNVKFLTGKVEKSLKNFKRFNDLSKTILIVDPPRNGLHRNVREVLSELPFAKIIYISCAPDTLCRDLKVFSKKGWKIAQTGVYDMFPRTGHFESLTVLEPC
ncbi:TRAM domain-containing protein [Lentisphaerota bacterium WC36G]|nr:TRAM domain-containing protein [Lentisphaerae bacterium WC36]